jgi:hypothetical protein
VQVRTDEAALARSAHEAARELMAPGDREWADLARSSVGRLTAAEVSRLILHVHATAGRFAERHRGERVAELVYRLFPPRYFSVLRSAMTSIKDEETMRLPQGFDPPRTHRLILRVGPEQTARQLGLTSAVLRVWWASERQVHAV